MDATVERVEVERLSLPLHSPFATARRQTTTADSVIVRVTDSDGRVGLGEAPQNWPVLGASVAGSVACLEGRCARPSSAAAADAVELWPLIDRTVAGNTSAKGALDSALRDLADGPAVELPTLVTVPVGEPDAIAETARLRVAEGFRTLKLKVGTDAATDVARVRACREGAGPDVAVRVDANTGWDCFEAVRVIRALEDADLDIELVEQPVARLDLAGLAHVRRHVATPFMADESVFGLTTSWS